MKNIKLNISNKKKNNIRKESREIVLSSFNKKAQHEILGFVLIVLIVTVIGLVFLSLSVIKGKTSRQSSIEVSNLLESAMYYTTDCATSSVPDYKEVQDLIKECNKNPAQVCIVKDKCEEKKVFSEKAFSLNVQQGPWEHQSPNGNAIEPLLILSDIKKGQKIIINNIRGKIYYHENTQKSDCRDGGFNNPAMAGFYNDKKKLIKDYEMRNFEKGIETPSGATKLYAYIREPSQHRNLYYDNRGGCSFLLKIEINNPPICNNQEEEKNACIVLESTLRELFDNSLDAGEDSANKAYRFRIYFNSTLDNEKDILYFERGIFKNCSAVIGGSHPISISSFSAGEIEVELEVCRG